MSESRSGQEMDAAAHHAALLAAIQTPEGRDWRVAFTTGLGGQVNGWWVEVRKRNYDNQKPLLIATRVKNEWAYLNPGQTLKMIVVVVDKRRREVAVEQRFRYSVDPLARRAKPRWLP